MTSGGHYAVEDAAGAQFGDGFRPFGALRRRRNQLEYPHLPNRAPEEAEQAAETAQRLITAAGKLLPQLSLFSREQELRDYQRKPVAWNRVYTFPAFADSPATVSLSCRKESAQAAPHANRRPSWDPESQ